MTYTVVFKDYTAKTFGAALAKCFRDPEVFKQDAALHFDREFKLTAKPKGYESGANDGYSITDWQWDPSKSLLRVWFR